MNDKFFKQDIDIQHGKQSFVLDVSFNSVIEVIMINDIVLLIHKY